MKKACLHILATMLAFQLFHNAWKAIVPLVFGLTQPFEMKMVAMTGMIAMTIMLVFVSRAGKTNLSLWQHNPGPTAVVVLVLSVLMLVSTAVFFTHSPHGWWMLLYGSIVTPLFEELLFRGHIFDVQQRIRHHTLHIVIANALLFSVWHLGYIVQPLLCGEWMALSKLAVALIYGLVLAYIRCRTKSTLCSIMAHAALNSFLG